MTDAGMPTPAALALMPMPSYGMAQQKYIRWGKIGETDVSKGGEKGEGVGGGSCDKDSRMREKALCLLS
jgi:hypothetical protein